MDSLTRLELDCRILAAIIHRPATAATAFHHITKDLWLSACSFSEHRCRIVADAAWTCWSGNLDTSAANIRRAAKSPEIGEAIQWLLGSCPPEDVKSLDRLAREVAALIRRDELIVTLRSGEKILADDGDVQQQIAQVQQMVAAGGGSNLNIVAAREGVDGVLQEYSDRKHRQGAPLGVPTGLWEIDKTLGGLAPRAVTILGARPSQGKTAIASCIALEALRQGHPCIFFSHEMAASDILQRMACQSQGLSFTHLRSGRLSAQGERKLAMATDMIRRAPLHIVDTGGPSPLECRNTALYLLARQNLSVPPLIVVDYIQLEHLRGTRLNRAEELTEISAAWCETAKITGAACLILAQLNRQADGSQPRMSQLRESGALEQDANTVMLLWRPAKDRPQDDDCQPTPGVRNKAGVNWAVLSVAKSRNSDLCEQELHWDGYCMRYRAWDDTTDQHLSRSDARIAEANQILSDIVAEQPQDINY